MSGWLGQFLTKDEVTYGTPVTPLVGAGTKAWDINSESITVVPNIIKSNAIRRSTTAFVARSAQYVRYLGSPAGAAPMEVLSRGFGWWLKYMTGGVAGTAGPVDSAFTHTSTFGSLNGDAFTAQVGRPRFDSAASPTIDAYTYHGGKLTGWDLELEAGGILLFTPQMQFEEMDTTTALGTPSYPTAEPLIFCGGDVTIGGSSVNARKVKLSAGRSLTVEDRRVRATCAQVEPREDGERTYSVEVELDYDNRTQQARVESLTNAGSIAAVNFSAQGQTLVGATAKPSLSVAMATVMFMGDPVTISGPSGIRQVLKGEVLDTEPVITYVTLDATAT